MKTIADRDTPEKRRARQIELVQRDIQLVRESIELRKAEGREYSYQAVLFANYLRRLLELQRGE